LANSFQRAVREGDVGGADALADRLGQDVLADDVLVVGDEQVVGDRQQGRHAALPGFEIDGVAVGFPGLLDDGQALVDHQQFVSDGLGDGGGLAGEHVLGTFADLGPLLGHDARGHHPDQRQQRQGDDGDGGAGGDFRPADMPGTGGIGRNQLCRRVTA
jgi:hypothetical protein